MAARQTPTVATDQNVVTTARRSCVFLLSLAVTTSMTMWPPVHWA